MNSYDVSVPDEFIYCNVLIFDEIHKTTDGGFYTSQKALCMMTNYRFFELYLHILSVIYNLYKIERFNILQDDFKTEHAFLMQNTEETIVKELTAATRVPLIFPEVETVLKLFYE